MKAVYRGSQASIASIALLMTTAGFAFADGHAVCTDDVRILAQPQDGLTVTETFADEFRALSGVGFQVDYLNENHRREKSAADAAHVGRYNVYYVDEANLALFVTSNWIVPLEDYYPASFDYSDFDEGRRTTATYDEKVWFAPIQGGGDLMVYRTDLLNAAGIDPPTTLEELFVAVEALHDPANGVYGTALRGQAGSGANVWRWMPYFRGFGGEWFDTNGSVAFNSEAAVVATEAYLKLFEFSPPNTRTGSWNESTEAFNSGQVALIVESAPLGALALDPENSSVSSKVAFAIPPSPLTGGGYAHGFAIGSQANLREDEKSCAALWIAWATSKENELRRLEVGKAGGLNRTSVFNSTAFVEQFGEGLPRALEETASVTAVNFWQDPNWPELGGKWGELLEDLVTGRRDDIQGALDELETFANGL